jgi:hypothetical protein
MRSAGGGIVARQAEPEPNKYTDIGKRNSRESIVLYAGTSENYSSDICDRLKLAANPTRGFSEQILLLDATRKRSHSGIFFKSPQVQNLLSRPDPRMS